MKTFAERLKHALFVTGESQAGLARAIGIKQQGVNYLCSKGRGSKHSPAIARHLGISLEWLTEGRGDIFAQPSSNSNVTSPRPPVKWAPIVAFAQAGDWGEVIDCYEPGDAEHFYPVPPNIRCSASSFWTEVQGRSMDSTTGGMSYPHGSLILVDPEVRDAITGHLILARLNDTHEATFKRLNVEGERYYLEPLNTQYSVIEIASDAQIIGTVQIALVATS